MRLCPSSDIGSPDKSQEMIYRPTCWATSCGIAAVGSAPNCDYCRYCATGLLPNTYIRYCCYCCYCQRQLGICRHCCHHGIADRTGVTRPEAFPVGSPWAAPRVYWPEGVTHECSLQTRHVSDQPVCPTAGSRPERWRGWGDVKTRHVLSD